MGKIAQKHEDELENLKGLVVGFRKYFEENYENYHKNRIFLFKSNLSSGDVDKLNELNKPVLEFNVLEAYVSRQRGEFSKQEPSISVNSAPDSGKDIEPDMIEAIEGHMRAILSESKKNAFEYDVYTDQLSGGFSVIRVWTEYENEMSFNQKICIGRSEPTLCGFDPLARLSHKGDGEYCFEIYPVFVDDLKEQYPNIDPNEFTYRPSLGGFLWSYKEAKKPICLVCDFYKKKGKKVKLCWLSNNQVMTQDQYDEQVAKFTLKTIAQPPAIQSSRMTSITGIVRYRFIETQVLEYKDTDFKHLPLIFVDGNSFMLKEDGQGAQMKQFTRSYIYNVIDSQRFKNLAGQTMANQIENLVSHKFIAPKEGIPEQYKDAYIDVQQPRVMVYNAFTPDGRTPIPPPQPVQMIPTPPEVSNAFMQLDQTIQSSLGSYDASLGINNNQLSGVAVVESATQSNAAAMPYVVNFMSALSQAANVILNLIPKLYITPRTIPVVDKEGKRTYKRINDPTNKDSVNMIYGENDLNVEVEAGVNFEIQRQRALQTLEGLGQAFPAFAAMIQEKGLPILADNLDIRGADQLKQMAEEFTAEQAQMKAAAMKAQQQAQQGQQGQINPLMLKQQELQQKQQALQQQNQHKMMDVNLEQQKINDERDKTMINAKTQQNYNAVQLAKVHAETLSDVTSLRMKKEDQAHRHAKDIVDHVKDVVQLNHDLTQPTQPDQPTGEMTDES